jgi:hypothetical protein
MSGGGGSTTTNNIPQWVQDAGQNTYNNYAVPDANQSYTPYTGQQVAPLTSTQNAAISAAGNNLNAGQGALAQGVQNATNAGNYTPSQVGTSYSQDAVNAQLNPYTQNVINTTNATMQQQNQIANAANDGNATSQGAYGGDRNAVQDALTNQGYAMAMANTDASLNQSNYTNAQSQALAQQQLQQQAQQSNQSAGLSAAGLANQSAMDLGMLGSDQSNVAAGNYATAMNAGSVEQQQQQNIDNVGINQYTTAQNWPLRQLSILEGALNQTPYSTSTTTQGSTNTAASALGGAAAGAEIGSSFGPWGTAIGGIGGGIAGLL